jgi:hypothetical protein
MKQIIIAGLLVAAGTTATAQPFEFQQRIGSTEYDAYAATAHLRFAEVDHGTPPSSLERWMLEANVDAIAPNHFEGGIVRSGPSRISLYEVVRDSPEGIAYRDYHERYPVGTDWDAVARDYRDGRPEGGIAAEVAARDGDS